MASFVDDLLLYSQIGSIKNIDLEYLDLKTLIEEIKLLIEPYLNKENASVNVQADDVKFFCNKSQMFLLFKNLITNGIK